MNHLYFMIGIVIFMILCLNKKQISNYVNYDKLHENPLLNCPEQYEIGMKELGYGTSQSVQLGLLASRGWEQIAQPGKRFQTIQPFGYTKHQTFDMTRFIETDIPLPVDPDFFM